MHIQPLSTIDKPHWQEIMNNLKTINLIGNIFLILNLVVGLLQIHWAAVIVFAIIHTVIRMMYLKTEQQNRTVDPERQRTVTAPPAIRNFATVISGIVMAAIIYAIGYGIRYGFNVLMA